MSLCYNTGFGFTYYFTNYTVKSFWQYTNYNPLAHATCDRPVEGSAFHRKTYLHPRLRIVCQSVHMDLEGIRPFLWCFNHVDPKHERDLTPLTVCSNCFESVDISSSAMKAINIGWIWTLWRKMANLEPSNGKSTSCPLHLIHAIYFSFQGQYDWFLVFSWNSISHLFCFTTNR